MIDILSPETAVWQRLHNALTGLLPQAGVRQFGGGGQTVAELELAAAFTRALQSPLRGVYYWPFRNGFGRVPDSTDRAEIEAWLREQYGDAESGRVLATVLALYMVRAFVLGGQYGLDALAIAATFALTNEALRDSISGFAVDIVDIDGEMSLTNTTAVELAREIERQRLDGVELALGAFIAARVLARARLIAETEMVRFSRLGLVQAFWRNGVGRVIFRNAPELSQTGPCPICKPLDGNEYGIRNGRVSGPEIPIHGRCVCYYDPVLTGWERPSSVWVGG